MRGRKVKSGFKKKIWPCGRKSITPRCSSKLSAHRRPLRKVLVQVAKVAPADSTVLILGESGAGKELNVAVIHKRSNRSARAFIRVNCAAIPSSLMAPELFGHEKGAFTGAMQRRLGRFELADGGTIFLDEAASNRHKPT